MFLSSPVLMRMTVIIEVLGWKRQKLIKICRRDGWKNLVKYIAVLHSGIPVFVYGELRASKPVSFSVKCWAV